MTAREVNITTKTLCTSITCAIICRNNTDIKSVLWHMYCNGTTETWRHFPQILLSGGITGRISNHAREMRRGPFFKPLPLLTDNQCLMTNDITHVRKITMIRCVCANNCSFLFISNSLKFKHTPIITSCLFSSTLELEYSPKSIKLHTTNWSNMYIYWNIPQPKYLLQWSQSKYCSVY